MEGVRGVYLYKITVVPREDMPDVLRVRQVKSTDLQPGAYVRVKRGIYGGDLAKVRARPALSLPCQPPRARNAAEFPTHAFGPRGPPPPSRLCASLCSSLPLSVRGAGRQGR